MSQPSLLPSAKEEFRSKDYWQKFFKERGGKTFEWYGEWNNFAPNVKAELDANPTGAILVPGCGNSKLTEDLWHAGYKSLTSVDYDRGVIKEMSSKTAKRCPGITWLEMDCRKLDFPDASFAAVFDKGTLDAMLPDQSATAAADMDRYFSEVSRVLAPGGCFILISLLQEHVLAHLARWHAGATAVAGSGAAGCAPGTWAGMHIWTFAVNDLTSPLCPFFIVLRKGQPESATGSAAALPVTVHVPHRFEAQDSAQAALAASMAATGLGKGKGTKSASLPTSEPTVLPVRPTSPSDGPSPDVAELTREILKVQWSYHTARQLQTLTGETYLQLDLWARAAESSAPVVISAVTPTGDTPPSQDMRHRYTVTVVDVPLGSAGGKPASAPSNARAAVVLVPLGREHEFSFCAREGQLALARQVGVHRLLFVTMGREWSWAGITPKQVQSELDPVIPTMVPRTVMAKAGVPYLAVAEDLGSVHPVASGATDMSGPYRVEDVDDDEYETEVQEKDDGAAKADTAGTAVYLRRLVFASNQAAIQTEVAVRRKVERGKAGIAPISGPGNFIASRLSFPYHQAMAACLGVLKQLVNARGGVQGKVPVLVLGLGGGALASYLVTLPWVAVLAVELDPGMVGVAREHFGLQLADCSGHAELAKAVIEDGPAAGALQLSALTDAALASLVPHACTSTAQPTGVTVVVGNALEVVKRLAGLPAIAGTDGAARGYARPAAIVVDVDAKAKELKTGLSFPPLPFVAKPWLACTHSALDPGLPGMLCMNLGARAKALYAAAIGAVEREYGAGCTAVVPTGDEDGEPGQAGDLNAVVAAVHVGSGPGPAVDLKATVKASLQGATTASGAQARLRDGELGAT